MLMAPNITHLISVKLDSMNYLLWKAQLIPVLISYDLLSYVDGSIPSPPQSIFDSTGRLVVNPSYVAWVRSNQSLRSWINTTLTKDSFQDVHDLSTSHEVWVVLEQQFEEQFVAKVLILDLQIQTLKKGTNSMENYLRTLKQIANSLAAIGSPISSQDLMLYGLSGLPSEYELFVIAITAQNGLKSFADLRNKLLQQEHRIHNSIQLSHDSTTTFVTVSNTKFRGRGRGHGGRGLGCGGRGSHGGYGYAQYHRAMTLTKLSESPWYSDSGATAHMTPNSVSPQSMLTSTTFLFTCLERDLPTSFSSQSIPGSSSCLPLHSMTPLTSSTHVVSSSLLDSTSSPINSSSVSRSFLEVSTSL
ncbi:hypothetical protein ACH5RR_013433 [Cinchona calisaya]|uniref:Retrotransposon Copia-like N-terminal domain-containing protein n=1 Tax=Cinchona calisaya TaxID=153742 RepID=A0ABD3A011_9GENT